MAAVQANLVTFEGFVEALSTRLPDVSMLDGFSPLSGFHAMLAIGICSDLLETFEIPMRLHDGSDLSLRDLHHLLLAQASRVR